MWRFVATVNIIDRYLYKQEIAEFQLRTMVGTSHTPIET